MTSRIHSIADFVNIESDGGIAVIYAEEPFFRRELKKETARKAKELPDCDYHEFDGMEDKEAFSEALSIFCEVSIFSSRRILMLHGVSKLSKEELHSLKKQLGKSENENLLILMPEKMDKRTSFYKTLSASDVFYRIPEASRKDAVNFIREKLSDFSVDPSLTEHLVPRRGSPDFFHLASETDKIALYASANQITHVTMKNTADILCGLSEEKIYVIIDFLMSGKKSQAVALYRRLKVAESEHRVNPIMIAILFKHFKALYEGTSILEKKGPAGYRNYLFSNRAYSLLKGRNVHPDVLAEVRKTNPERFLLALGKISILEKGLKGSEDISMSDVNMMIERFMLEFF